MLTQEDQHTGISTSTPGVVELKTISGKHLRLELPLTLGELGSKIEENFGFVSSSIKLKYGHHGIVKLADLIRVYGEVASIDTVWQQGEVPGEKSDLLSHRSSSVTLGRKDVKHAMKSITAQVVGVKASPFETTPSNAERVLTVLGTKCVPKTSSYTPRGEYHRTVPSSALPLPSDQVIEHAHSKEGERKTAEEGYERTKAETGEVYPYLRPSMSFPDRQGNRKVEKGDGFEPPANDGPIPFPLCPFGLDELFQCFVEETTTRSGARIPAVFPVTAYSSPAMQFIIEYVQRNLDRLAEVMDQIYRHNEPLYRWITEHSALFLRLINNEGPTVVESQRYALVLFARQVANGTMELVPGRQEYFVEIRNNQYPVSNMHIDFTIEVPGDRDQALGLGQGDESVFAGSEIDGGEEEEDWDAGLAYGPTMLTLPQNEEDLFQALTQLMGLEQLDEDEESKTEASELAEGARSEVSAGAPASHHVSPSPGSESAMNELAETLGGRRPPDPLSRPSTPSPDVTCIVYESIALDECCPQRNAFSSTPSAEGGFEDFLARHSDIHCRMIAVVIVLQSNPAFWIDKNESDRTNVSRDAPSHAGPSSSSTPSFTQLTRDATAIIDMHHRLQELSVQIVEELGKSFALVLSRFGCSDYSTYLPVFRSFLRISEAFFCDCEAFYVSLKKLYFQRGREERGSEGRDKSSSHPLRASLFSTFEGSWRDHVDTFAFMSTISRLLVLDAGKNVFGENGSEGEPIGLPGVQDGPAIGGQSKRFSDIRGLSGRSNAGGLRGNYLSSFSALSSPSVQWMVRHGARGLMGHLLLLLRKQNAGLMVYSKHHSGSVRRPPTVLPSAEETSDSSSSDTSSSSSSSLDQGLKEERQELGSLELVVDGGVHTVVYMLRGRKAEGPKSAPCIEMRVLPSHPLLSGGRYDDIFACFTRLALLSSTDSPQATGALTEQWETLMRHHYSALVHPVEDLLPSPLQSACPNGSVGEASDPFFYVADMRFLPSFLTRAAADAERVDLVSLPMNPARYFPAYCDADGAMVVEKWTTCVTESLWQLIQSDEAPVHSEPPHKDQWNSLLLSKDRAPPVWLQTNLQRRLMLHQQSITSRHCTSTFQRMVIFHEEAARPSSAYLAPLPVKPSGYNGTSALQGSPSPSLTHSLISSLLIQGDLHVVDEFLQPSHSMENFRNYLVENKVSLDYFPAASTAFVGQASEPSVTEPKGDETTKEGMESVSSPESKLLCRSAMDYFGFTYAPRSSFHSTLLHHFPFPSVASPLASPLVSSTTSDPEENVHHFFSDFYSFLADYPQTSLAAAVRCVSASRARRYNAPWLAIECSLQDFGGKLISLPLLERSSIEEARAGLEELSDAQYWEDHAVDALFDMMIKRTMLTQPTREVEVLDDLLSYMKANKEEAESIVEQRRLYDQYQENANGPTSSSGSPPLPQIGGKSEAGKRKSLGDSQAMGVVKPSAAATLESLSKVLERPDRGPSNEI